MRESDYRARAHDRAPQTRDDHREVRGPAADRGGLPLHGDVDTRLNLLPGHVRPEQRMVDAAHQSGFIEAAHDEGAAVGKARVHATHPRTGLTITDPRSRVRELHPHLWPRRRPFERALRPGSGRWHPRPRWFHRTLARG